MTLCTAHTDDVFRQVLAHQPDVLAALSDAHEAAWLAVDNDLLELCRLRIASLLGFPPALGAGHGAPQLRAEQVAELSQWPTSAAFSTAQRACLAYTEQYIVDVAAMPAELVAAVLAELGADGLLNFANALLVVEQRMRLHLMWARLLPAVAA
ncbi:MAG: hypothetical protein Q7V88_16445 [Actinomycetota bacterium]|nr:hypothetical protein [Actinomycetota bacterium]